MQNIKTALIGLFGLAGAYAYAQAPVVDLNSQSPSASSQQAQSVASGDLETRLSILERKDANRIEAQQRIQRQLDTLQGEVDEIRGTIELHNHQLEKILQRQRELYLEIDNRFNALRNQTDQVESDMNTSFEQQATASMEGGGPEQGDLMNTLSEEDAYQSAVDMILKERDYERAIPAFEGFLNTFPSSKFTDNAHYWLGQLLYNKQDWRAARVQFSQVVENFPDSSKRADAIYKLGMLEKSQANLALAKEYFEQLLEEYPDTSSARLASRQLNDM